jgi:hypothetical protein
MMLSAFLRTMLDGLYCYFTLLILQRNVEEDYSVTVIQSYNMYLNYEDKESLKCMKKKKKGHACTHLLTYTLLNLQDDVIFLLVRFSVKIK